MISLWIALWISLIWNKYWPFDDEWFWIFLISLWIIKFFILSNWFIESQINNFIEKLELKDNLNINKAAKIKKEEKIEKIVSKKEDEEIINLKETDSYFEAEENYIIKKEKDFNNKNQEVNNNYYYDIKQKEDSKFEIFIKNFFAENLLAKIWSILVFLGVLFLMSLIWNQIPNVLKIIIGFIIWFWIYFTWVILDQKWLIWESRILLWAWILINFLVILSWRYLIWWNFWEQAILSTWITFVFLIFNAVFWILTSLVYKSRTLLIFSFVFAYLNPFLIWWSSETPYVLIWYSMIVSLWALFVWIKQNDDILKYTAFVLWNLLFLLSPFNSDIAWISKMISTWLLWFITLINFYKSDSKQLWQVFIINYIFIIFQLIIWWNWWILSSGISYITYMISILAFFGIWIFFILSQAVISIFSLLFFPVFIILWLIFSWVLNFVAPTLAIVVFIYLIWFSFLTNVLSSSFKYFFFVLLAIFIFFVNWFISFWHIANSNITNFWTFLTTILVSFVFLFTSYIFSTKKDLQFLYTIWTLWTILILLPIIVYEPIRIIFDSINWSSEIVLKKQMYISIISVILFAISNQLLPFINKNIIEKTANIKNLVIGSVFWVLFISWELFIYWNKYFPWVSLWLAFWVLAILYFILWYLMMNKIWFEQVKKESVSKNTIYSYLFISISIFSLAIALVFSKNTEIISTLWLFEASILFYFYNKTKENKIFIVSIILFMIWIFNLFTLIDIVRSREYLFLVPFTIIWLSFVYNLINLNTIESWIKRVSHDLLHILWIWVLAVLLVNIIPNTWYWWSIFGISIFIFIIWNIYAYFNSNILKVFFIIAFWAFMLFHLEESSYIVRKIDRNDLSYLRILQYISTFILWLTCLYWKKFNKVKNYNNFINLFYAFYLIFILSFYVEDIFNTTFAVTIFWWTISFVYLFYWISIDKIKYRTIWLYILTWVLLKIFVNDLWLWNYNAATRVLALIWIWILLIIISTRYSKKYWNNLKWEFSFDNLKDIGTSVLNNNKKDKVENNQEIKKDKIIKKEFAINKKIENIDISNIKMIEFDFAWKKIKIRAVNLIKIVKLVIDNYAEKTKFKPKELLETYKYIKENFKSELSRENYNKIVEIMEEFVNVWGEIKIIEK